MASAQPRSDPTRATPAGFLRRNTIGVLAVLLLAQLALIAFIYWPVDDTPAHGELLLGDYAVDRVISIQVDDSAGQSVTLLRAEDGWVVADTDEFPANRLKAEEVLTKLLAVNTNRLVTRTAASHSRLQVAATDFNRRITITDADGNRRVVFLGISSGGAATHVRIDGDDRVYLTGQIAAWEVDPFLSGWIDTTYFSTNVDQVRSLHFENPNGAFRLARTEDKRWMLTAAPDGAAAPGAPAAIDQGAVDALINRMSFISLQDVLGKTPPPAYTADDALIRIELTRVPPGLAESDGANEDDGATEIVILEFGPRTDAGAASYFVKSSTSEYYVAVSSFTVENLLEARIEDLLVDSTEDVIEAEGAPEREPIPQPESNEPDADFQGGIEDETQSDIDSDDDSDSDEATQ